MTKPANVKIEESPAPDENSGGGWRSLELCFVIVGLILFYIASVGPVAWLWYKMNWNIKLFRYLYAPVIWLHDHTPLETPLEWWVELFV